ncbi:MAG: hypothetical protein D6681_06155 [Calditrichaeota bacterium]|nr:MAG: hypothetical protein D6681_06155 [Calditrichota bacterium]
MLDAGYWILDVGCWPAPAVGRGYWMLACPGRRSGILDTGCSILDTGACAPGGERERKSITSRN